MIWSVSVCSLPSKLSQKLFTALSVSTSPALRVCLCQCSEDEGRRMKRREKNRVAAQKSRKRQTQRADLLHEACELLEQRNRKLRREVDSLSEEQHLLTEALRAHEPFCPIMHCSFASSTSSTLQPENMAARSV
uniref:Basic leucine zipper transcription factor, ATF-like 3 n=1 Tax=Neolamprologus brichardi TaxID=32507 RepID=A0A3Q4MIW1_NEOBR